MKKTEQKVYCTYFDKHYLLKGLALHSSLMQCHPEAKLWILCFDDYTYNFLSKIKLKRVTLISQKEFEDDELLAVKPDRTRVEYLWTCTPSLPLYVMEKSSHADMVVYLDADLYFFSGLDEVFDELGKSSVYTVEHRYPNGQEGREKTSGKFNVGFQIFRNSPAGKKVLKRWRDQCIEWCYWRLEDGKLGDQLYLNEWPKLYKNDLIISKNIGVNAAPWNIEKYRVTQKDGRVYLDQSKLICYHFHQFQMFDKNQFEFAYGYQLAESVKDLIYNKYCLEMDKQLKIVKNIDPDFKLPKDQKTIKEKIMGNITKVIGPIYWRLLKV